MNNIMKLLGIFILFLLTSSMAIATAAVTRAQAVLYPVQDNHITGRVMFYQFADGVKVTADISGLQPGKHGFEIHSWGDCGAAEASTAGGHFNPSHTQHGAPEALAHHVGDLGNIVADASGKGHYEGVSKNIHLNGADSIIGRSVIVHSRADDLHTQPTGNSGGGVACGIIGVINPSPEKG